MKKVRVFDTPNLCKKLSKENSDLKTRIKGLVAKLEALEQVNKALLKEISILRDKDRDTILRHNLELIAAAKKARLDSVCDIASECGL